MDHMSMPGWIVLARGTRAKLRPTIFRVMDRRRLDHDIWIQLEGTRGYIAVIDEKRASSGLFDELLAKALSKATKKRAYLVAVHHDDYGPPYRITAYDDGKSRSEVKAGIDDVLVTLGFKLAWMDPGKKVPLRTETPMVKAKRGEAKIWNWTVSQWLQMMRKDDEDFYALLDGVDQWIDTILALCSDADPKVRLLMAKMLEHVGHYGLKVENRVDQGLAALDKLVLDRSPKVRKVATETRKRLLDDVDYEAVKSEFPWISTYDERRLAKALALLDRDRPIVHRYVYKWLEQGANRSGELPAYAIAKLETLAETTPAAKSVLDKL